MLLTVSRVLPIIYLLLRLCAVFGHGLPERLTIDGEGSLVDPQGQLWWGRGVNWGKRVIVHGNRDLYNATDPEVMKDLLGSGVNHVRLVLDWFSFLNETMMTGTDSYSPDPATGYLDPAWLAYIDNAVEWVTSAGLWITITIKNEVGTQSPKGGGLSPSDIPCSEDFIGNSTLRGEWLELWQFLAHRYSDVDRVAWYEPASEPHLTRTGCHEREEIVELLQEVATTIRQTDPRVLVALAPDYAACPGLDTNYDFLGQDLSSAIVYIVNWFNPTGVCQAGSSGELGYGEEAMCRKAFGKGEFGSACVTACNKSDSAVVMVDQFTLEDLLQPAITFKQAMKVPVWLDQLGCVGTARGVEKWMADTLWLLQRWGIHFSWWTWKGISDMAVLQPQNCSHHSCELDLSLYHPNMEMVNLIREAFDPSEK